MEQVQVPQTDKVEKFTKCLMAMLDVVDKIFAEEDKIKLVSAEPSPVRSNFKMARAIISKLGSDCSDILFDFEAAYARYKGKLMNNLEWIRTDSAYIQLGDNLEGVNANHRIQLSVIYRIAFTMMSNVETKLAGQPAEEYNKYPLLNYPDALNLHLYRIWALCAKSDEIPKLLPHIDTLEISLGLKRPNRDHQQNSGGGLISSFSNILKGVGVPIPEGAVMPTDNQVASAVSNIFGNLELQQAIKDAQVKMNNCKSGEEMMASVASMISSPKVLKVMQDSMGMIGTMVPGQETPMAQPQPFPLASQPTMTTLQGQPIQETTVAEEKPVQTQV